MIDSGWGVGLAIKRSWVQFPVGPLSSYVGQPVVVVVVIIISSIKIPKAYSFVLTLPTDLSSRIFFTYFLIHHHHHHQNNISVAQITKLLLGPQ